MEDNTSRKTHSYPQRDSLCWNCKKALSLPDCHCSWSKKLIPVKGWKAIEGGKLSGQKGRGKVVLECPEYVQYYEYTTWKEAVVAVAKELEISAYKVLQNPFYWFRKYENKTGKTLPGWAVLRAKQLAGMELEDEETHPRKRSKEGDKLK